MATYSDFVRDGYQRPIPGATVKLFSADGTTQVAMATTGADGKFTIDAADGKYLLQASFGGVSDRSSVIVGNPPEYVGPPGQGLPDLMGPDGSGLVGYGAGNVATALDTIKASATVSVLDFIDPSKHAAIKARTFSGDLTAEFQAACAEGAKVVCPAGDYPITGVGIRDTVVVGEGNGVNGTRLIGLPGGTAASFMLDAMLDTDGTTPNTYGGGWAQDLTLVAGTGCTRSGLRTYGGGAYPRSLNILGLQVGASFGLPIWMKAHNLYAEGCKVAGFHTFSGPGDSATSLSMDNCWANHCYRGFHITQLIYSTFNACVAQDCTEMNWFIEGNANGVPACYSLTFISPATEGGGVPFYFRKVRDLYVVNPRIISPDGAAHLMTLDDVDGEVVCYSTPGTPPGGKAHLDIINHGGGLGAITLSSCVVALAAPLQRAFATAVGTIINGSRRTTSGQVLEVDADTVAERRYIDGADIDGYTGMRMMSSDGTRLMALRRIGGAAISSNGPFGNPALSLQPGDIVPYATDANFKLQVKTPNGTLKTVTLNYDA